MGTVSAMNRRLGAQLEMSARHLGTPILCAAIIIFVSESPYLSYLATSAMLMASMALSLNIVVAWTKQLSLAHAGLYGVGAYTTALLNTKLEWPAILTFPLSMVAAVAVGLMISLPTIRMGGAYFAIATIGFQMILVSFLNKGGDLTGGPGGIAGVSPFEIFGWTVESGVGLLLLVSLWLSTVVTFLVRLRGSRFGWEMRMAGGDPQAAEAAGVPVVRTRVIAFALSSSIAGGAGALYVHSVGVADPQAFGLSASALLLVVVLIGGRGSIPSVLMAALLLSFLPEYLRSLADVRLLIFGLAMMAVVLFLPNGISGLLVSRSGRLWPRPLTKTAGDERSDTGSEPQEVRT